MPKYYDISGKMARNYLKKFYRGKVGKQFRKDVQKLVMERQPFTGAESFVQGQLGEGGFYNQLMPTAEQMQYNIGLTQPLIQRAAQGRFYDITPIRQAAERQFARTTGPGYFESRFAGGPYSSGFAEGFGQQARDMAFNLGSLEAQLNAGAQQQLALGGGLNQYLQAQQTPFAFTGQGLENLLGLGAGTRTSYESTRPGAAPLVPTFLEGPFSTLSNIEQNARIKGGGAGGYEQGGQAGGWFF
jgi:hypothetical protein